MDQPSQADPIRMELKKFFSGFSLKAKFVSLQIQEEKSAIDNVEDGVMLFE